MWTRCGRGVDEVWTRSHIPHALNNNTGQPCRQDKAPPPTHSHCMAAKESAVARMSEVLADSSTKRATPRNSDKGGREGGQQVKWKG